MIVEIGLLLAGAETAISTIKRAVAVGRDAGELIGEFTKVFDAQDAIIRQSNNERQKIKAASEAERSAMSEALDSVIASRKIQKMMADLQRFIVWELQEPQLWQDIMQERNAIIARRKAAELAAKRAHEKKVKRIKEVSGYVAITIGSLILTGLMIYGAYLYSVHIRK